MAEPVTGPAGDVAVRPIRFAALQVTEFRWYWLTSWISSTGDGMENVIRGLLVVQLVGIAAAPFWLGMMVFAHWVPFTVFSLYGGTLADRYDNRKVQIAAQLLLGEAQTGTRDQVDDDEREGDGEGPRARERLADPPRDGRERLVHRSAVLQVPRRARRQAPITARRRAG